MSSPDKNEDDDSVFTKMEFAVQMTCQGCVDAIKKSLECVPGVRSVYVSVEEEVVLVETSLPSSRIQQLLEGTGRLVVFRGFGGVGHHVLPPTHHGAAVAIMRGEGGVRGLARLVQITPERCVIEGTVDGLSPGTHPVSIHQFGDISQGCQSCGDVYDTPDSLLPEPAGSLGPLVADGSGRGTFQVISERLKVWEIIGRSMVIHSPSPSHPHTSTRVMCGIIARSAGLFQNTKKVCTCDGVTLWDEARKAKEGDDSMKASL